MSAGKNKPREPLVKIATAPNQIEAEMWKGILQENGIPAMIKNTSFLQVTQTIFDFNPVEVYVLASNSERAREVLVPFVEEEP